MSETQFKPVENKNVPEEFVAISAYDLTPKDIQTTPPAAATLYMSPDFTNPKGADADSGKTRDYIVEIEYPPSIDDTVVKMDDCPTVHGSRIFHKFVESVAEDKGYTKERISTEELN